MLTFLLANWRIIALLGAIIAVFVAGEHYGASRIQMRWDEALLAQEAESQRIENVANEKAAAYEKEAAKARADNELLKGRLSHVIQANHALASCVADADFVSVYSGVTLH